MRKTKKQKSQQTVKPDSISLEEIKEFAYQNFVNEDREQYIFTAITFLIGFFLGFLCGRSGT